MSFIGTFENMNRLNTLNTCFSQNKEGTFAQDQLSASRKIWVVWVNFRVLNQMTLPNLTDPLSKGAIFSRKRHLPKMIIKIAKSQKFQDVFKNK